MPPRSFLLPVLALAGSLLLGAGGPPEPALALPWYWSLEIQPRILDPGPGPQGASRPARAKAPRLAGGAMVEVWGDADQETLRVFKAGLRPALVAAYDAGLGSSIGWQILGEIMGMGAGFHPPSVASVWYNAQRPVIDVDPVKLRIAAPFSHVQVSGGVSPR